MSDCYKKALKRKKFIQALVKFKDQEKKEYEKKLDYSTNLIEKTLKKFSKIAVACSFGKDSMMMLHLIRQFKPNILVVFANTGVQYPETYKHRDFIVKEWNLNFQETKPIKPFWECVREYGYPNMRLRSKKGKKTQVPKCCIYCKERPVTKIYKERGIEAVFVGITHDESYQRRYIIIKNTDNYYNKTDKIQKILPIAYFSTKEVWHYTKENKIPINEVYKKCDRSGCMPCTAFIGWEKQLARNNPKMYKFIVNDTKNWQKLLNKEQKIIESFTTKK